MFKQAKVSRIEMMDLEEQLPLVQQQAEAKIVDILVQIEGMTCSSCSGSVEQALRQHEGIISATISLLQHVAQVSYDSAILSNEDVCKIVDDAGFEAKLLQETKNTNTTTDSFNVSGMTCSNCSASLEQALLAKNGVQSATVSLTLNQAQVSYSSQLISKQDIIQAISDAGFEGSLIENQIEPNQVTLHITGMTCSSCSASVKQMLENSKGVIQAQVDLINNIAQVDYNPQQIGRRDLVEIIQNGGFDATVQDNRLIQNGHQKDSMTQKYFQKFLQCLWFMIPFMIVHMILPRFQAFGFLHSVQILNVSLMEYIKWILVTPIQVFIGRQFHIGAYKSLKNGRANMDVLVSLGTSIAYIYSVYAVVFQMFLQRRMAHAMQHNMTSTHMQPKDFFETSAMLITWIYLGKYIESKAKGKASDALTKLLQLTPERTTLIDGGKWDKICKLPNFKQEINQMQEKEIQTLLLQPGDIVKVLPGQRIPGDGQVAFGESQVDESMLTGESSPVQKNLGYNAIGGTVNLSSILYIKIGRVGSETALQQIVRLVQKAQMEKTKIQDYADRVSSVFVPVVLMLGLLTFLAWFLCGISGGYTEEMLPKDYTIFLFSLQFAIAVIVTACPCALGLATPTAVMVGTGLASQLGILIKGGGEALESAQKVTTVLLDKTGTITTGYPQVTDVKQFNHTISEAEFLSLLDSSEVISDHPIARAIRDYSRNYFSGKLNNVLNFKQKTEDMNKDSKGKWWIRSCMDHKLILGKGIVSWQHVYTIQKQSSLTKTKSLDKENILQDQANNNIMNNQENKIIVGSRKFMVEEKVQISDEALAHIRKMEDRSSTCICLAVNKVLIGIISVMDPIKPEARGVIQRLHQMKLDVYMVTGDDWGTARAISEQLAIKNVTAEVLPSGKMDLVKQLQQRKKVVMMVGDGINDSPSIKQADVGISIASGTDIAVEAADYILMRNDLEDIIVAIDLSKKVFGRIKLNFLWAIGYNALIVPLAAGIFYPSFGIYLPPVIAGISMALSSISVVCSSLLLNLYKRPPKVLRDVEIKIQAKAKY